MNIKQSIIEIDYAIAFTTGSGKIYINKNLKDFDKELYDKVLKHEMQHSPGYYDTHDLKEDLSIDFFPLSKKIAFCLKYPKAWLAFSPVIITKDEICVSWLGILKYLIAISLIILMVWWL